MAIIRAKDAAKMSAEERKAKLQELRFELIKAGVTSQKSSAKSKEIKRAIARLLTVNKSSSRTQPAAGVRKNKNLKADKEALSKKQ